MSRKIVRLPVLLAKCVKECPKEAISIIDMHAVIDTSNVIIAVHVLRFANKCNNEIYRSYIDSGQRLFAKYQSQVGIDILPDFT